MYFLYFSFFFQLLSILFSVLALYGLRCLDLFGPHQRRFYLTDSLFSLSQPIENAIMVQKGSHVEVGLEGAWDRTAVKSNRKSFCWRASRCWPWPAMRLGFLEWKEHYCARVTRSSPVSLCRSAIPVEPMWRAPPCRPSVSIFQSL